LHLFFLVIQKELLKSDEIGSRLFAKIAVSGRTRELD
jgi:hypothetical protein